MEKDLWQQIDKVVAVVHLVHGGIRSHKEMTLIRTEKSSWSIDNA